MAEVHHLTEADVRIIGPNGTVQARARAALRLVIDRGRVIAWLGEIRGNGIGGDVTPQEDGTLRLRLGLGPEVTVSVSGPATGPGYRGGIGFRGNGIIPFEPTPEGDWRVIGGSSDPSARW